MISGKATYAQSKLPAEAGAIFRDCPTCPEMVVIPAGSVEMGDSRKQQVAVERPFAIGRTEVTFAQWDACVAAGGCSHKPEDPGWGRDNRPVINVSYIDAQQYVKWISAVTGASYRLPTEAEWEYAARAGTTTMYSWGDEAGTNRANCDGCGSQWDNKQTAPVASFQSNAWNLYDVHGNVWEWVEDCFHDDDLGRPADGAVQRACPEDRRILRSGSWNFTSYMVRSAVRYWLPSNDRYLLVGFRLARTID